MTKEQVPEVEKSSFLLFHCQLSTYVGIAWPMPKVLFKAALQVTLGTILQIFLFPPYTVMQDYSGRLCILKHP